MDQADFEEKLQELEGRALRAGLSLDNLISAYELRKMALEEEVDE